MEFALLGARLLLVAVFGVAGLAKLADRPGTRRALTDFGVPAALVGPLGPALALMELSVAVALLSGTTARWGAAAGLALLLLFVGSIAVNLAHGRRPDCHCFGQLAAGPVGPATLARNGVLAAVALAIVWQGPGEAGTWVVAWFDARSAGERTGLLGGLVVLGLVVGQSWLLLWLLRRHGRLLLRIDALEAQLATGVAAPTGLPVGSRAPSFRLADLDGLPGTPELLTAAGRPVVLVFADPACGPCTALWPELSRWQREHAAALAIAVISRGAAAANRAVAAAHGVGRVFLQADREVAAAYRVQGTPSAVLLMPDGAIGSPVAAGAAAILALVRSVLADVGSVPSSGERPGAMKADTRAWARSGRHRMDLRMSRDY